jgi:hypothetical protein
MQKTLVFSIALNGYSVLFQDCLNSQIRYCQKFGYKYSLIKKLPYALSNADAAWLKLYLLREATKLGYKWIAFIDADCEIREHSPDFRQIMVNSNPKASIFMAQGFSGRINSGVIFLKNAEAAISFLSEVIKHRYEDVPEEDRALYENGHVIHFGRNNPQVQIIDNKMWNNNYDYNKESYIQHHSGGILRQQYLKDHKLRSIIYLWYKRWKIIKGNNMEWEQKKHEILKGIVIQNFS